MPKILKALTVITPALMLAFLVPGPAAADDDDGYYHRKHVYHQIGHRWHYGHHGHGFRHHYHRHHRHRYGYRRIVIIPKPVYVTPKPVYKRPHEWHMPTPANTWPGRSEKIRYREPEPKSPAATCLMTREYQTQVVVGGELVPGYGYACLQPDGSWYRGPAVPLNN